MEEFIVSEKQTINFNTGKIPINQQSVIEWKVDVIKKKGLLKSSYITLLFTDKDDNEITRRIKFITQNSDHAITMRIASAIPGNSVHVKLGYRVNTEGAIPSDVIIQLIPIGQLQPNFLPKDAKQEYDDFYDYLETWNNFDLEKNYWSVVGGHKDKEHYISAGKYKVKLLQDFGLKETDTILDVGCGTGILVEHLRNYLKSTKNYVGVDIASQGIEFCKKHYPDFEFHTCSFTKIPNLGRKFDVICLFSVFTHLYPNEIVEYLLDMKHYLNTDGYIVADIIKNSNLFNYTGTKNRVEYNEDYFIQLIKSAGFSEMIPHTKGLDNVQLLYKIH